MHPRHHAAIELPLGLLLMWVAAGCGGKGTGGQVPDKAEFVSEKSGGFAFVASDRGTLYIFDVERKRVVCTTPLRYADRLIFHPGRNRVIVNGNVVKEGGLEADHAHRLYFLKG